MVNVFDLGYEYGISVAECAELDTMELALKVLADDYDAISELIPYPLSGEWAGGSINEMADRFGIDLFDVETADEFEEGFSVGYERELKVRAAEHVTRKVKYR